MSKYDTAKQFLVAIRSSRKVWEITTPPTLCYKIPPVLANVVNTIDTANIWSNVTQLRRIFDTCVSINTRALSVEIQYPQITLSLLHLTWEPPHSMNLTHSRTPYSFLHKKYHPCVGSRSHLLFPIPWGFVLMELDLHGLMWNHGAFTDLQQRSHQIQMYLYCRFCI